VGARPDYVHGYSGRERERLADQADTLAELLHSDTFYPSGSVVLEVGCGVGAQTVTLARRSPEATIVAMDISEEFLTAAQESRLHERGVSAGRRILDGVRARRV
jgi:trans-aconitate methyltransferase